MDYAIFSDFVQSFFLWVAFDKISRRREALLSLTIGKVCFKSPAPKAGFFESRTAAADSCNLSRKFSERLLRPSKRLSGKAEEQKP